MVTQSTRPRGGQPVLDADKQRTIVGLMSIGFSRRMAACYVGCAPSTITRTAARDQAFGEEVARASQHLQLVALKTLMRVVQQDKYWRAAVWICERLSPQQFAPRQPRQYTAEQVMHFYARITDTLMEDVPEANRQRAREKLAGLFDAMELDEGGIPVEEFPPEPEVVDEPSVPEAAVVELPEASQEIGPTRPSSDSEPSRAETCHPDREPIGTEACRPENGPTRPGSDSEAARPGSELEGATPVEPGPARPNGSASPLSSAPPPQPSDRPSPSSG